MLLADSLSGFSSQAHLFFLWQAFQNQAHTNECVASKVADFLWYLGPAQRKVHPPTHGQQLDMRPDCRGFFIFIFFIFVFYKNIFCFRNLQEYTPAAPLPGDRSSRDPGANSLRKFLQKNPCRLPPGSEAAGVYSCKFRKQKYIFCKK